MPQRTNCCTFCGRGELQDQVVVRRSTNCKCPELTKSLLAHQASAGKPVKQIIAVGVGMAVGSCQVVSSPVSSLVFSAQSVLARSWLLAHPLCPKTAADPLTWPLSLPSSAILLPTANVARGRPVHGVRGAQALGSAEEAGQGRGHCIPRFPGDHALSCCLQAGGLHHHLPLAGCKVGHHLPHRW